MSTRPRPIGPRRRSRLGATVEDPLRAGVPTVAASWIADPRLFMLPLLLSRAGGPRSAKRSAGRCLPAVSVRLPEVREVAQVVGVRVDAVRADRTVAVASREREATGHDVELGVDDVVGERTAVQRTLCRR